MHDLLALDYTHLEIIKLDHFSFLIYTHTLLNVPRCALLPFLLKNTGVQISDRFYEEKIVAHLMISKSSTLKAIK